MFDIKGKVAVITGGASGIGLSCAREFLKNGLKGVTLVDIDENAGRRALVNIQSEYGDDKAIFIKTDITSKDEFDAAFSKTLKTFQHVDILINNAGIYNDLNWDKEIDINIKGTVNGIILGLETYLKKFQHGSEGIILNTASIAGLRPGPWMPIYGGTKSAIIGMTQSWGQSFHYKRTKVRVVAVCPGGTNSSLFNDKQCSLTPEYMTAQDQATERTGPVHRQSTEFVAKEVVNIIKYAPNGSLWVVEYGQSAYQYLFPERDSFKNNVIKEN